MASKTHINREINHSILSFPESPTDSSYPSGPHVNSPTDASQILLYWSDISRQYSSNLVYANYIKFLTVRHDSWMSHNAVRHVTATSLVVTKKEAIH